jgi:hypothetical protein
MEKGDFETFVRIFDRLANLPLRDAPRSSLRRKSAESYFRILHGYPLEAVKEAGRILASTRTRFPAPCDWLKEITDIEKVSRRKEQRLTESEALEYMRAKERVFSGEPCSCPACIDAGVSHLEIRFVPDLDESGREVQKKGRLDQEIPIGHWAHGQELRAWYGARQNATGKRVTFEQAIQPSIARRRRRQRFSHLVESGSGRTESTPSEPVVHSDGELH